MCRAAPYLRELVARMLTWSAEGAVERWGGYIFTAVDATIVTAPGSTGIDARIHTKLRVADVSLKDVQVTDDRCGESFRNFSWEPGELAVGDRAYGTARGIDHVTGAGADVLVRYRLGGLTLCTPAGVPLDVLQQVRKLEQGELLDLEVHALLERRHIDGRFIAMRLPEGAAERARKRLQIENRKKVRRVSAQALEAAGYVMLFTTTTRERLDAHRCLRGYRLRWQIELQFKRWKSLCSFDSLPNQRDDTTLAWLYGKVLLGALLDRMASIPTELSPPEWHALGDAAPDVVRSVEADEHPLSADRRVPPATHAA
jgi:Transposase DDE domain